MAEAFICDATRTPIGRYGGALSSVRTDDLAALPISALMVRNQGVDWEQVDDVIYGCANQAGEDNRNVARMAGLLAGLPKQVPGMTVNSLCGSSMDAVGTAARAIRCDEAELVIAGGVESMSRSPFVMPKAGSAFSRDAAIYDTTIGWRFINPKLSELYTPFSMGETAENVAKQWSISREDQDQFAWNSQQKWKKAHDEGVWNDEIIPISIPNRKGDPTIVDTDEHPRPEVTLEKLSTLKPVFSSGDDATVTAGNSSGVNDGAAAMVLVEAELARKTKENRT